MPTDTAAPVVLYVEDEILIQMSLRGDLEDAGFRVMAARDGAEALAMLVSESPVLDGLITDVHLGRGPDGWDIARSARVLVAHLPVVYVSAASIQEWSSRGVPNSLMIAKPFQPGEAIAAMTSLLAQSH